MNLLFLNDYSSFDLLILQTVLYFMLYLKIGVVLLSLSCRVIQKNPCCYHAALSTSVLLLSSTNSLVVASCSFDHGIEREYLPHR